MDLTLKCPNCDTYFIVNTKHINCSIFRHGIYKETMLQIDPHASKDICETLVKNDEIYGCGKPFKLLFNKNPTKNTIEYYAEKCEYI